MIGIYKCRVEGIFGTGGMGAGGGGWGAHKAPTSFKAFFHIKQTLSTTSLTLLSRSESPIQTIITSTTQFFSLLSYIL